MPVTPFGGDVAAWERWSGWRLEPLTGESCTLVAVWEKPDALR